MAKIKVHILLEQDEFDAIDELSKVSGASRSEVIRQLIRRQSGEIKAAIEGWKIGGLFGNENVPGSGGTRMRPSKKKVTRKKK